MMSSNGDGGEEYLAPVTDLFSRKSAAPAPQQEDGFDADGWWVDPLAPADDESDQTPWHASAARSAEHDEGANDDARDLGPEAPRPLLAFPGLMRASELSDSAPAEESETQPGAASAPVDAERASHAQRPRQQRTLRAVAFVSEPEQAPEPSDTERAEAGERALLKRLAGRGMSVAEAQTFLQGMDVPIEHRDRIIDDFMSRRYLDDAVLAEQLVYTAQTKKKQGRRAVAQALKVRGLTSETIEAALADLPDDDAERALEYARSKATALAKLDRDVALRRLVGQLARRGFGGNVAMTAAKTALGEVGGVRFR